MSMGERGVKVGHRMNREEWRLRIGRRQCLQLTDTGKWRTQRELIIIV
jgi:hypothetical protein